MSQPRKASDAVVLYLHIPKTAGGTLSKCIYHEYRAEQSYQVGRYFHAGVYYYPIGFFGESGQTVPADAIRALGRTDLRAVVGHFSFGIHRYLTNPSTYVTILRDPVERLASLFYHFETFGGKEMGNQRPPVGFDSWDGTLETFFRMSTLKELDNDQTRRICGLDSQSGVSLSKAKQNLREHFAVVGVTERFDESLILLKRRLGWARQPHYFRENVNPGRSPTDLLPVDVVKRIRERNELDIELYQFAQDLLEEAVSDIPGFQQDVAEFKDRNTEHISRHAKTMGKRVDVGAEA